MMFSFAITGSITATTLKFVKIPERKKDGILFLKVTNIALSLENKLDITVREFIFHYAINSCAYLKGQFP